MATKYWRGGDCNNTANWNDTEGAGGGASLPTSANDVLMDLINPISSTATVNATMNCANLDFTGFTGTFAGGDTLNVYGNFKSVATMTRTYNGALQFRATSGTKTITTNGITWTYIDINGNGGTFQLQDNLTLSASTVYLIRTNGTFDTNGKTVSITATSADVYLQGTFAGTSSFYNLTITGSNTKTALLYLTGDITASNNLTINGNSSISRLHIKSGTVGTARTLTCNGTLTVTNADFQDITGAGSASWDLSAITGLSGDCGGNSGITFTTPSTQDCSAGTIWSTATWTSRVPLPQDTATFSGASRTITQDMPRIGSVDFTGSSGLTWTTSTACSVYGSINLTDLATLTASTQTYTFSGRGSYTLTSASKTWGKSITVYAPSGTLTLQGSIIMESSRNLVITMGEFNANNYNVTCGYVSSSNSNTRTITMGSGVWELQTQGTAWTVTTSTGLTLNCNTSTIKYTNNSVTSKTFAGGGKTYYNLWNATQDTGTFTITGSNTFNQIKTDTGRTTFLTASTTTKISAIDMVGATLQSTTATDANLDLQNILPLSALDGVTLTDITVINNYVEPVDIITPVLESTSTMETPDILVGTNINATTITSENQLETPSASLGVNIRPTVFSSLLTMKNPSIIIPTPPVTFQSYLDILTTNIRRPKIKVQFLRFMDETPYTEITGDILNSSGNLTINNKNGTRRAIDLTLSNVSGNYTPSPDTFWLGQKFKVYFGLEDDLGEVYYIPQGVFVSDNPTVTSNYTVSIKGVDKFALLDGTLGGEIDGIYQITLGSNIYNAIKSILTDSNIISDPVTPILDILYKDEITPYTIEKETGSTLGEIILELAALVSANVYYDVNGKLVFEQDFDDKTKSSQWDFSSTEFNYISASQDYKFNEVFNSVLVIGDNINGQIFDYQAINTNLQSSTSVPNLGFKRVKVINDTNINTEQRAMDRANYELKRVMAMQSEFTIDSVPIYHLDVDKIITLTDGGLRLDKERILINSISIPISIGGKMSIKAVKSIDLLIA